MNTLVGKCIEERNLQYFYVQGCNVGLFRSAFSFHHCDIFPESSYLPGQYHLPQRVIEFKDRTTALIAVEIESRWENTVLIKWWRVLYLHPDIEQRFQEVCGIRLQDIPIGDNERFPPKEEEEE